MKALILFATIAMGPFAFASQNSKVRIIPGDVATIEISGPVAEALYEQMTSVSPVEQATDEETSAALLKEGQNLRCMQLTSKKGKISYICETGELEGNGSFGEPPKG